MSAANQSGRWPGWISRLLRPVHAWFFLWEDVLPSLYRVVAVASAAGLTTLALRAFGVGPTWVVAIGATLGWIGLGVAQEHDERIRMPTDDVFVAAVRAEVDELVGAHGYDLMSVGGGRRARKDHTTTLFYGSGSDDAGLWIQRDPKPGARHGSMTLRLGFVDVAQQLAELGHDDLAARLSRTIDPAEDARVVREALTIALAQ